MNENKMRFAYIMYVRVLYVIVSIIKLYKIIIASKLQYFSEDKK